MNQQQQSQKKSRLNRDVETFGGTVPKGLIVNIDSEYTDAIGMRLVSVSNGQGIKIDCLEVTALDEVKEYNPFE